MQLSRRRFVSYLTGGTGLLALVGLPAISGCSEESLRSSLTYKRYVGLLQREDVTEVLLQHLQELSFLVSPEIALRTDLNYERRFPGAAAAKAVTKSRLPLLLHETPPASVSDHKLSIAGLEDSAFLGEPAGELEVVSQYSAYCEQDGLSLLSLQLTHQDAPYRTVQSIAPSVLPDSSFAGQQYNIQLRISSFYSHLLGESASVWTGLSRVAIFEEVSFMDGAAVIPLFVNQLQFDRQNNMHHSRLDMYSPADFFTRGTIFESADAFPVRYLLQPSTHISRSIFAGLCDTDVGSLDLYFTGAKMNASHLELTYTREQRNDVL